MLQIHLYLALYCLPGILCANYMFKFAKKICKICRNIIYALPVFLSWVIGSPLLFAFKDIKPQRINCLFWNMQLVSCICPWISHLLYLCLHKLQKGQTPRAFEMIILLGVLNSLTHSVTLLGWLNFLDLCFQYLWNGVNREKNHMVVVSTKWENK